MALFTLETMRQAHTWQELSTGFRWHVPPRFNLGWDCCERHASGFERPTLYFEEEGGAASTFSFRDIQQAANRLSNALRALQVSKSLTARWAKSRSGVRAIRWCFLNTGTARKRHLRNSV